MLERVQPTRITIIGLLVIILAGFVLRLVLATQAPHPGVSDPNHYYNLARNLAEGRGFVIDYVWQYHDAPAATTHPTDYYMPLPGVWPAISFRLLGQSLFSALLPSVILGTLLAVLTYGLATAMKLLPAVRLMAVAPMAFLPEFVLNSVRTDTTISYVLFAGGALLFFYLGLRHDRRLLALAGLFASLAHLTRLDGLLLAPTIIVALVIHARYGGRAIPWRWVVALFGVWLLVISPWLWRNYQELGSILPAGAGRTRYMTSFIDQFTFGRELTLSSYLAWGIPNILKNIAFQALANVKTMYTVLDVGLPILALVGLGGLILRRDRERLLFLAAPAVFLLGLYVFYSFITPFHTQGGSFKKSYMVLIPFLAVVAAWALATYVQPRRVAYIVAGLMAIFMGLNAIELTRADFRAARTYDDSIIDLSSTLNMLGDNNGDERITVMTQDPFILNYHGFAATMLPSDDRDTILEAARRYGVDYIILPAARPALDTLYNGIESDPRLPMVDTSGIYQLLAVDSAANE